jgi:RHH-type rel operon transcriptional repressor/antitoxin RelB
MPQVHANLPIELLQGIDEAARKLDRTRADLIRQAVEYYLEDLEDLTLGLERLRDPADPVLDWEDAKRELLCQD